MRQNAFGAWREKVAENHHSLQAVCDQPSLGSPWEGRRAGFRYLFTGFACHPKWRACAPIHPRLEQPARFTAMNQVTLSITPKAASAFTGGLSVSVSVGSNPSYQTVPAVQQPDGTWLATPDVQLGIETSFNLIPAGGTESKPYDGLDTSRKYTPTAATPTIYAVEGIYGLCARGPAHFAEPPSRIALMEAAFGGPVAHGGIFDGHELPHGATLLESDVYFVVHAPHAVCATLILAVPNGAGGLTRQQAPMSLTQDNYYWWCTMPTATARRPAPSTGLLPQRYAQRGSDRPRRARFLMAACCQRLPERIPNALASDHLVGPPVGFRLGVHCRARPGMADHGLG